MSLDAPKICERCGENENTYGHDQGCLERRDVDWREAFLLEREKFQRETLRTSQLTKIVRRFVEEHHVRGGHPASRWSKACDLCVILADALELIGTPLNARLGGSPPQTESTEP
jgi:hypothetical protein